MNAPGYVYLMVSKPLDFHKIGMTTDHPEAPPSELTGRLRGFPKWYFDLPHGVQPTRGQRSVADPLRILWYAPASNPREAEKALHAMFWHRRVDKRRRRTALDWFALTDEDVETICAMQGDKFCLQFARDADRAGILKRGSDSSLFKRNTSWIRSP